MLADEVALVDGVGQPGRPGAGAGELDGDPGAQRLRRQLARLC
jgi:hypothetical protein